MCTASGAGGVHIAARSAWWNEVAAGQGQCPVQVLIAIAAKCFSCCWQLVACKCYNGLFQYCSPRLLLEGPTGRCLLAANPTLLPPHPAW